MKVIICGPRDFMDYQMMKKAIKASGFEIKEVISGNANGADYLGEQWATENKIKIKLFPANWQDMSPPCSIKERKNYKTGKMEKYNSLAGFNRNSKMVERADAIIAIQLDKTPGTQDTIDKGKKKGIPVFIYPNEMKEFKF